MNQQFSDASMGSDISSILANIVLGDLENTDLQSNSLWKSLLIEKHVKNMFIWFDLPIKDLQMIKLIFWIRSFRSIENPERPKFWKSLLTRRLLNISLFKLCIENIMQKKIFITIVIKWINSINHKKPKIHVNFISVLYYKFKVLIYKKFQSKNFNDSWYTNFFVKNTMPPMLAQAKRPLSIRINKHTISFADSTTDEHIIDKNLSFNFENVEILGVESNYRKRRQSEMQNRPIDKMTPNCYMNLLQPQSKIYF